MTRLFVAVWPPPEVVEALTALRRKDERGVRFVPPEKWHITLRFLGEADADEVADRLSEEHYGAASAQLGPAVDLLGQHSVIIPVAGLDDLARQVAATTRDLGDAPPRKRYVGHLTLARLRRGARPPRVTGTFVDDSFDVTEIALVRSRLRQTGAEYDTVATWPTKCS